MEVINTESGIIFITSPKDTPPWRIEMEPESQVWTIERTPNAKWIVKSVRHLSGEENHGNHHVYVDAQGANGNDLRGTGLNIIYGWNGMGGDEATPAVPIDKPEGEFGCNVPIFKDTEMFVEMHGAPSERVSGLRTNFGDWDAGDGNSWGHQSFHVVFVYQPEPRNVEASTAFVSALNWEYHPAGEMIAHHVAKISDLAYAAIVESRTGQFHARIATPTGINLTPIQMLNSVEQAKEWIEQEAQKPQYHQESIA